MSKENADIWTDKDILINERHEKRFLVKKRKALLKSEDRRRRNELRLINKENRYLNEEAVERSKKRTTPMDIPMSKCKNKLLKKIFRTYGISAFP